MTRISWQQLSDQVAVCEKCALCQTRTHTAFGEGNLHAKILFVGEGPGQEEDRLGRPFVGPAGKLLDRMLLSIDLNRDLVYIANVVKCRPPQNRNPQVEEAEACLPYLRAQYALLHPQIVVCLGAVAAKYLIDREFRITRDRGKWIQQGGAWFLATYHPAALLRDETKKRDAWTDMRAIAAKYKEVIDN